MTKPIAIVAGEPNSISSEIVFKSWKLRKKFNHKPFFVIGNIDLLKLQKKKLNYQIKIKKIDKNFKLRDLMSSELPVFNVKYKQKKAFEKISSKSKKYILDCFDHAVKFSKNKKIIGFINCPVAKEFLFKKNYQGITEFISKKFGTSGSEAMLIYNKKLSVCPITTHIPLKHVSSKLNKNKIIKKVKAINSFYKQVLKKKPNIAILGLNPHNYSPIRNSEEKKFIVKSIKILKKINVKVFGPISPDSSFVTYRKYKYNVIVGMYHDQVLTPFKALFKHDAINITLGLPFIRISPDHGIASNIVGKKIANPKSLIESIKFFNHIK